MKTSDWISVNDKLPKLGERVLICIKLEDGNTYVDIAQRYRTSKLLHNINIWIDEDLWVTDGVFILREEVTHWQSIILPQN